MSQGRGQAVAKPGAGSTPTPAPIQILLPGFLGSVGNDITTNWLRVNGDLDLTGAEAHIVAKVAPGTTAAKWDIQVSTNGGTSFATILSATLTLAVGSKTADLTPTWAITTFSDGHLLRVDLTQTDDGTCADVVIYVIPTA